MIVALIVAGVAFAGGPPCDQIPWDSALINDTIVVANDTIVTEGYWVYYITREKYEFEVLGWRTSAKSIRRDLGAIKAILKEKK